MGLVESGISIREVTMAKTFVSRNGKPLFGSAKEFDRWNNLPYGRWTCASGRIVLFNRFYEPIWDKQPGGDWTPANPAEWVTEAGSQEWFYDDATPEAQKRRLAQAVLDEAKVPVSA